MNLKTFIEKKKKEFIIVAIVLSLVGSVIAAVFSFFNGRIQTIGYIISIVIFGISAVMFCIIAFLERKKSAKQERNVVKNTPVEGQKQNKTISQPWLIGTIRLIICGILCMSGVFMIIFSDISAVRIAGIVLASVFGAIIFIIGLFLHLFIM